MSVKNRRKPLTPTAFRPYQKLAAANLLSIHFRLIQHNHIRLPNRHLYLLPYFQQRVLLKHHIRVNIDVMAAHRVTDQVAVGQAVDNGSFGGSTGERGRKSRS